MTDNGFCLCDNTLRSDLVSFEYEMLVVPAAGELQCRVGWDGESALWFRLTKNQDISAGPLARPFALSLTPLTRLLATDCSLRLRPPLRSLVCSLAHFLACGKRDDKMIFFLCFFSVLAHSEF